VFPRSRFDELVAQRIEGVVQRAGQHLASGERRGVKLDALAPEVSGTTRRYRWVTLEIDETARVASLTVRGPGPEEVAVVEGGAEKIHAAGSALWALRAYRELDDALLNLRVNHARVGVVLVRALGDGALLQRHDAALVKARNHWFAREVLLHMGRVLRRMDNTSRSFFALGEQGTAFVGNMLELALASDRFYLLDDSEQPPAVGLTELNEGALPMHTGLTRVQTRLLGEPAKVEALVGSRELLSPEDADEAGLVTVLLDDIDWDDDTRIAIEERSSLSPDALTGMEQNLRFPGPETPESKIYARLSAWQNWIFIRPNATGPEGALTLYGRPERPQFDWQRV
jgi:benzoyl-CoA-dihydrodiol lyase